MVVLRSECFSAVAGTRNKSITDIIKAKDDGKKVIGHYCAYRPVELALAAGAIAVPLCGNKKEPFFAGGVTYNRCMRQLLARELGILLTVAENPQTVGALGAALRAAQRNN